MNLLSITISKKLFFIFLINSIITVTISGMVMISFLGLSGQFNYNSELSTYKTILDSIRIEQSKLKGHAQSFYLPLYHKYRQIFCYCQGRTANFYILAFFY